MIDLFIEYGADINKYGKQIYNDAKKEKNYALVQYLKDMMK